MTEITPAARAWLNADRLAADLSLDELLTADTIRQMDMATYAQLRQRAGLAPIVPPPAEVEADDDPGDQVQPVSADAAIAAQFPGNSPDFGSMTLDEYSQVRERFIRPASGRGIFD